MYKIAAIVIACLTLSGCAGGLERYKKYIWPDKKEQRMIAPEKSKEHMELIESGEIELFEMKEGEDEKKKKTKK